MRHLIGAVALLPLALAGCGEDKGMNKIEADGDAVYHAKNADAMTAAVAKARATSADFLAALKAPKADQPEFAVKIPIVDGEQTEHFWMTDVTFDGTKFRGTINNVPIEVKNVKMGDIREVTPEAMSDWMFIEKGVLRGGYTIRALRDEMNAAERAEFDKSFPYKID